MPAQIFSIVWPLAFSLVVLAGIFVCIAGLATLVLAIARARKPERESADQTPQDGEEMDRHQTRKSSQRDDPWQEQVSPITETYSQDGIHYIPIP